MKTDNYLNLCLEQAAKSPLHYRHGAIVVRGGKVIGQGFNDYRPGFNGGALKHGRIACGGLDGQAMTELKAKLKKKKQQQSDQQQNQSTATFTPFESSNGTGGGHSVNQPLSMHSEMMAIYSALSTSSTLSSTTFSREKPCFKLPRGDKRKARLRRDALMAYVAAVCETSSCTGKSQVQQYADNNKNKPKNYNDNDNKDKEKDTEADLLAQALKDAGVAFHETSSGEKHHQNQKTRKHLKCQNEKKKEKGYQYQYQYGRYGSQTQHGQQAQAPPFASKRKQHDVSCDAATGIRRHDSTDINDEDGDVPVTIHPYSDASQSQKRKSDCKKAGKTSQPVSAAASHKHVLLPKARAGEKASNLADRKQHPRLRGADLYVTRLGWSGTSTRKPKKKATGPSTMSTLVNTAQEAERSPLCDDQLSASTSSLSSLSTTSSHSATGSLHDELINREPSPTPMKTREDGCGFDHSNVHASRPCYRCIAFMHSVGIRRVFWTNEAGQWEGGKVAALVASMEGGMEEAEGGNGGPTGNGLFVTKHEVLMLRRMMGQKSG